MVKTFKVGIVRIFNGSLRSQKLFEVERQRFASCDLISHCVDLNRHLTQRTLLFLVLLVVQHEASVTKSSYAGRSFTKASGDMVLKRSSAGTERAGRSR